MIYGIVPVALEEHLRVKETMESLKVSDVADSAGNSCAESPRGLQQLRQ